MAAFRPALDQTLGLSMRSRLEWCLHQTATTSRVASVDRPSATMTSKRAGSYRWLNNCFSVVPMNASSLRTGTITEMNGVEGVSARREGSIRLSRASSRFMLLLPERLLRGHSRTETQAQRGGFRHYALHRTLHPGTAGNAQQAAHDAEGQTESIKCGANQQANVQPKADVPDVVKVMGQLAPDAGQIGVGGQLHLRQPRYAGADGQSLTVGREGSFQFGNELRPLRARADQAHVAAKDIPQLRQLVEMGFP